MPPETKVNLLFNDVLCYLVIGCFIENWRFSTNSSKGFILSLMSSFFAMNDFYVINPVSMDFLLDWIYIERPRSSYITRFLKNIFALACLPLDNTLKISKLLFQLKKMSSTH